MNLLLLILAVGLVVCWVVLALRKDKKIDDLPSSSDQMIYSDSGSSYNNSCGSDVDGDCDGGDGGD